jgi:hypothetical protein
VRCAWGHPAEAGDESGGGEGDGRKSACAAGDPRDDDVVSAVLNSCADLRERAVRRVDKEDMHLHSMSVRTKKESRGGTYSDVVSAGHPRPVERDVDARERPAVSAGVGVGDCDRDTLA